MTIGTKKNIRYIRLKERVPGTNRSITPSLQYCETADNLVRKPYNLQIDRNGFHFPSHIHENADLSIVFLGGSTTECVFVDQYRRFPYLVGRHLEQRTGLKINSFNSAVSDNNTIHSIDILINKVLPIRPRFVIMMHNINDLQTLFLENTYWNRNPDISLIVIPHKTGWSTRLYSAIENWCPNLYYSFTSFLKIGKLLPGVQNNKSKTNNSVMMLEENAAVREFAGNLKIFIDICMAKNITPILMTEFNRYIDEPDLAVKKSVAKFKDNLGINYRQFKHLYDLLNETIRTIGENNDTLVIDLARIVPQTNEYLSDHLHVNEKGAGLVSEIVSNNLLALLPVDRNGKKNLVTTE